MLHTHTVTVKGVPIGTFTVKGAYPKPGHYVRTVLLGDAPIGIIYAGAAGIHKGAAYGLGYGFTPHPTAPIGPTPPTAKTIKALLLTLGTKLAFAKGY